MADPILAYSENDGWYYYVANTGSEITAEQRELKVTIPTDGAVAISYEVKLNSVTGDATQKVALYGARGQKVYDLESGELVGEGNSVTLEIGKWYKIVTYKSDFSNLGTTYSFGYLGDASHNAGNASGSFRNFKAIYEEVTFATPGNFADPVSSIGSSGFEYNITGNSVGGAQRKFTATLKNGNATQLAFEIKLSNITGKATASIKADTNSGLTVKYYDANGSEVTSLTADAWYRMVITKTDNSALGTDALALGSLGGSAILAGSLDVAIRNVVVTAS
jgi:hypothetical protein